MNRRSLAVGSRYLPSAWLPSCCAYIFCAGRSQPGSIIPTADCLLLSFIMINLLNAFTAMYFSSRAVRAEINLKLAERRQREAGVYLNHHLRNALTVIQNAAFLTHDAQTIQLCDQAVSKIVTVLVSTEAGLHDPSERLFTA